jgi:SAM-dependent methyltransferase
VVSWSEFWNAETSLYVNARHRSVHYDRVTHDLIACVPAPDSRIVDYGCGDTLAAHRLAQACRHLYLCDGAPTVREKLTARYAGRSDITVISPEQFDALAPHTVDLIVANSVIQYISMADLRHLLETSREKLAAGGRLLLADVVPRDVGPLRDALELLRFAAANAFLLPAAVGLVRSYFSPYRRIRQEFGFLQFDEAEMLALLKAAGFSAQRRHPNVGHNSARMTFVATVA